MLSPDARTVAIDLLRPPPGHRLDCVVLTTYSLDLEALLALPLAVLAHADGGIDELLEDPLLVLEALREAGRRIHVFVDHGGIAIPRTSRPVYAMLESCVHPVSAPNGGAFHPKVWVARFMDEEERPLLRVAILSRNLTFDRSWDVALASEGAPVGARTKPQSRPLAELLQALPGLSIDDMPTPEPVAATVSALADEVRRTSFPSPDGFSGPIAFHSLGLKPGRKKPWRPFQSGTNLLAIAPFANKTALDTLAGSSGDGRVLVSRQETLDAISEEALALWETVCVLSDGAADEPEDGQGERPSGLHAKVIGIEHGWDATWFLGSANMTATAFTGHNVEMMASVTGRKGRANGRTGVGVERFKESGFLERFCEPYRRIEHKEDPDMAAAKAGLEALREHVLASPMKVVCAADGDSWTWTIHGELSPPPGMDISIWPISLNEDHARPLVFPSSWKLPASRLTAFVAFRLSAPDTGADDIRLTMKLPAEGMPEGREAQVLRALIDSPERFLRFLRALLGGLDGLVDWSMCDDAGSEKTQWNWGTGIHGETLLEDLVRAASRDPSRLDPVRRLIDDLRATEEGRKIVPDQLFAVWQVVDQALHPEDKG